MKRQIARFLGVVTLMVLAAIPLVAQSGVGYVADIKGTWVLNHSRTLLLGETLPAAGSIRRQSSSPDDRITIADMRSKILEPLSRKCENGNCSRVIILPGKAPSNWWLDAAGAALGAAAKTVRQSPRRKRLVESRSGELSEDVVKLIDGNIDLSSGLQPEGEQYLRWRVTSQKDDGLADWTKPIKLDKTALVPGFQAGLYEINLVRSNGSNFEGLATAWILVATPADYEKMRASFLEVQELTKKWGDNVKPETTRLFLQATLDNLARQAVK